MSALRQLKCSAKKCSHLYRGTSAFVLLFLSFVDRDQTLLQRPYLICAFRPCQQRFVATCRDASWTRR